MRTDNNPAVETANDKRNELKRLLSCMSPDKLEQALILINQLMSESP